MSLFLISSEIFYDVPTIDEIEIDTTEDCNSDLIYDDEIPAVFHEEIVESMECYSSDEMNYQLMSCNVKDFEQCPETQEIQHPRSLLKSNYSDTCKFKQTLTVNRSLLKINRKLFQDEAPPPLIDHLNFAANRIAKQCAKFKTTIKINNKCNEILKMVKKRKNSRKGTRGKRKKSEKETKIEMLENDEKNVIKLLGDVVRCFIKL